MDVCMFTCSLVRTCGCVKERRNVCVHVCMSSVRACACKFARIDMNVCVCCGWMNWRNRCVCECVLMDARADRLGVTAYLKDAITLLLENRPHKPIEFLAD